MRTLTSAFLFVSLAAGLAVGGCNSDSSSVDPPQIKSELQRDLSPQVSATDQATLVAGNTAFAFDLYQKQRTSGSDNMFFSPYSISQAVAMVYAGARTETATQIAQALHFTLPSAQLHPAMNSLDLALQSRGKGASGVDGKSFQLNIINALWGQDGYPFLGPFLDVLAVNYGAGLRVLNFSQDPDGSRGTINNWVSQQTAGLIPNLLPSGTITPDTRFVLTNAIYFNGAWASPFDKSHTQQGAFYPLSGAAQMVPMMSQDADYRYYKGAQFQAVELPYGDPQLAMTLIVPDSGHFADVEAMAGAALLAEVTTGLKPTAVQLTMPTFKFGVPLGLKQTLQALGMTDAFTTQADFSGIVTGQPLWISDVIHQAFVSVNEQGTEAAAATAVVGVGTAFPGMSATLTVDRPFLFLIRDIPTGSVLFLGRVMTP
jgi:serpin B